MESESVRQKARERKYKKGYAQAQQSDDTEGVEGGMSEQAMQEWILSQEMAREVCILCTGFYYGSTKGTL